MDIDIPFILGSIIGFAIVIGVLVTIHEYGHFLAARLAGMRVEVFSIGMGKRLFGYNKLTGFTFGDLAPDWDGGDNTDYRVAVLPIGGYVKVPGMIDESMDTDHVNSEPKPYEFRAKGAWAKAMFITAGVILNWFLAVFIFAFIALNDGVETNPTTGIGYVVPGSSAEDAGLRTGDQMLMVEGKEVTNWDELTDYMLRTDIGDDKTVRLIRDGARKEITLPAGPLYAFYKEENKFPGMVNDRSRTYVADVKSDRAKALGLAAGDTIQKVNNVPIFSVTQLINYVSARPSETVSITWKRGSEMLQGSVELSEGGQIGIQLGEEFNGIPREFAIGEALAYGWNESAEVMTRFINTIAQIFRGRVNAGDAIGGPIEIAKQSGLQLMLGDLNSFLGFMAMLSVILALINILPIPALDGGHLVIIIIEGVMRRELPTKLKIYVQYAGLILMLLLMIFVFGLDLMRLF